jgi:hypothetical protein
MERAFKSFDQRLATRCEHEVEIAFNYFLNSNI